MTLMDGCERMYMMVMVIPQSKATMSTHMAHVSSSTDPGGMPGGDTGSSCGSRARRVCMAALLGSRLHLLCSNSMPYGRRAEEVGGPGRGRAGLEGRAGLRGRAGL